MKRDNKKRSLIQIEFDKAFAIRHWRLGYRVRDIAELLNEEHKNDIGYSISYPTVQRDIVEVIQEAKKLRFDAGVDDLENEIDLLEDIYLEARVMHRGGEAIEARKTIEKLKGMSIEKQEITIKYDVNIEGS